MKKILIVSTVSRQFYLFEQGNIEVLHSLGYEVHGAANYIDANNRLDALDIVRHPFDIQRSPLSMTNIKAFKQLKQIMREENFDIVHCHSPMGGVLARLAANSVGISPVIYTAHGFHFYKGAPFINKKLFKLIEMFFFRYTDAIITINKEDYYAALKFKSHKGGNVYYVPGVGVNTLALQKTEQKRQEILQEIKANDSSILLVSVGELNKNKNHKVVISALSKLQNPNIHYLLCGIGSKRNMLSLMAIDKRIEKNVHFLGYRSDVPQLLKSCDIFIMPSYREGLSLALMEAMSAGLPCIASKIRGNVDLIEDGVGGYLCDPSDINGLAKVINVLAVDGSLRKAMGLSNLETIKKFDVENVKLEVKKIYKEVLLNGG